MPSNESTNYLLPLLPAEDFELLRPHLQQFDMVRASILVDQGEPIEYVYFPHTGIISLVVHMKGGGSVEAVMVGRDGLFGASVATANIPSFCEAVVQIDGPASRVSLRAFKQVFAQSAAFRSLAFRYSEFMTQQAQQAAACNAKHDVPARLARWLLRGRDVTSDDVLPFTQEFLSHMLGVRRPSVTTAAQTLEAAGLISYNRGKIKILNQEGLRQSSCECFQTLKNQYNQLFPGAARNHLRAVAS